MPTARSLWQVAIILGTVLVAAPMAQRFEAVSVRRSMPGAQRASRTFRPDGVFTISNSSLAAVIPFAYGIRNFQLAGGPDWVRTDRFDIVARSGRSSMPKEELEHMLQRVLEDRFKLVVRRERREMPVYALVQAPAKRGLGPNVQRVKEPCVLDRTTAAGPVPAKGSRVVAVNNDTTFGRCVPMSMLIDDLARRLGAEVVDKTGLGGAWDFDLSAASVLTPAAEASGVSEPSALITAVEQQLGLALEARRGRVEVLTIESVQQPTEN